MSFGKTKGGTYHGQNGNDDLAMTSINLSPFFQTSQFWDIGIETYENTSLEYRQEVDEKIFSVYLNKNSKSLYNFDELRRLNNLKSEELGNKYAKPNVFDLESKEHMEKIKNKFFKR
jgi:hypothetical protein